MIDQSKPEPEVEHTALEVLGASCRALLIVNGYPEEAVDECTDKQVIGMVRNMTGTVLNDMENAVIYDNTKQ